MSRYSQASKHFLGRGKLYVDRWDSSGNSTGERFVGNASVFEPQAPDDETQEIYDYAEAETPLLDKQVTRRKMTMNATLHEFTLENVALALFGSVSALSQSTGSVTDEAHTAYQGTYIKLAYRNVSSVVVDDGDTTTYVEGTDYTVDATTGRIYIMTTAEGGSIADEASIEVDYDYAADTSPTIAAGMATTIEGTLRFIGDPKRGETYELEVWHFSLSTEGALSLIGDDYGEMSLNFDVLSDASNHPNEQYYRIIKRAA